MFVFEARCYITNHWCYSLEVLFYISVRFDVTFQTICHVKSLLCVYRKLSFQQTWDWLIYIYIIYIYIYTYIYIIKTVVSGHFSSAQGMWLVYFSFTTLKRQPNGTKWQCDCCNSTPSCQQGGCFSTWNLLESSSSLDTCNPAKSLNWLEKQIKVLIHPIQHDHPKYSTSNHSLIVLLWLNRWSHFR